MCEEASAVIKLVLPCEFEFELRGDRRVDDFRTLAVSRARGGRLRGDRLHCLHDDDADIWSIA